MAVEVGNRVGIGLSYRPARLHSLAELILESILGLLKSLKIRALNSWPAADIVVQSSRWQMECTWIPRRDKYTIAQTLTDTIFLCCHILFRCAQRFKKFCQAILSLFPCILSVCLLVCTMSDLDCVCVESATCLGFKSAKICWYYSGSSGSLSTLEYSYRHYGYTSKLS
jgi:hypothetical protein